MSMPAKFELGGHTIRVGRLDTQRALRLKRRYGLPLAASGHAPGEGGTVYVRDSEGAHSALVHELIHQMDHLLEIGLSERQVVKLGECWYALLATNDFSFLRRLG